MNYLNHQDDGAKRSLRDQVKATRWAAGVLADKDALILDTETTGLDRRAQVIQLAILDTSGDVKMDTLLKPIVGIDRGAERVHGISSEMLEDALTIVDIYPDLLGLWQNASRVIIYNRAFDVRMLHQTFEAFGIAQRGQAYMWPCRFECAMERYAEWFGEWQASYGRYRWQKLPVANHTALGDCRSTLRILRRMAETLPGESSLSWSEIEDGA